MALGNKQIQLIKILSVVHDKIIVQFQKHVDHSMIRYIVKGEPHAKFRAWHSTQTVFLDFLNVFVSFPDVSVGFQIHLARRVLLISKVA
ncbi:MAG: hypothetical protein WCP85_31740 [Mariniphaga sp.]